MSFLRSRDYLPQIQSTILAQLTKGDSLVQTDAEENAQEEISSYLRQRFDISTAFANTGVYHPVATYNAGQLEELNCPAWINQNYPADALVSYTDGNAYICINATLNNEVPTNSNFWALLGVNFGLCYLANPYPQFDVNNGNYVAGNMVYWKNKMYECLLPSAGFGHSSLIQFEAQQKVPLLNIFPDDPVNGPTYWGTGTPYSVTNVFPSQNAQNTPAWSNSVHYNSGVLASYNNQLWQSLVNQNLDNIPGTDIIKWQPVNWVHGDNRDRSLVKNMVDMALYTLHSNIAPQNIPALRQKRYEKALEWCMAVAKGEITPNLPLLQPLQGGRIRIGGNIKLENTW